MPTIIGGTPATVPATTAYTYTFQDVLVDALKDIGAVAPGETPAPSDVETALGTANMMLDSWATRRMFAYVINDLAFPWGVSQVSYTIGPTGDFVAPRPVKIERANLIIMSTTPFRRSLPVLEVEEYAEIKIPTLSTTLPTRLYYQPTYPNGTLFPWPYPTDTSNMLELFVWNQLGQVAMADIANAIDFPPGYRMAITHSLAEELCIPFQKQTPPELIEHAKQSRANVFGLNAKSPRQLTDVPRTHMGGGMHWDPASRSWTN